MTNKHIKNAKDTIGLGIVSMGGMGAMGAMSSIPGMPASPVPGMVGAGLAISNIGQLSKNAMSITDMGHYKKHSKRKK
jgi:hypothetical protein